MMLELQTAFAGIAGVGVKMKWVNSAISNKPQEQAYIVRSDSDLRCLKANMRNL